MKIISTVTFVVISLFFTLSINAQANYLPGYVVNNEGDTISGEISRGDWAKYPKLIYFKSDTDQKRKKFRPTDIKAFKVKGDVFESAIVEIEISPIMTSKLEHDSRIKTKVDTVFTKLMVSGEKGLYLLIDENKKENYYARVGDDYSLLKYKRYLKKKDGKDFAMENKKYAGQLSLYFKDCPSVEKEIFKEARYTEKYLTTLFIAYQNCKNPEFSHKKEKEKPFIRLGVLAGIKLDKSPGYDSKSALGLNFAGGAAFEIVFPRNIKHWSIYNEVILSGDKGSSYYEEIHDVDWFTIKEYRHEYSFVNITNTARFNFTIKGYGVFVDAGITNTIAVGNPSFYRKEHIKFFSDETLIEGYYEPVRRRSMGMTAGMGIKLNRLFFEIRQGFIPSLGTVRVYRGNIFILAGYNLIN